MLTTNTCSMRCFMQGNDVEGYFFEDIEFLVRDATWECEVAHVATLAYITCS